MYQPPHFREEREEVLHDLIRSHSLGLLISNGANGMIADLVPFILSDDGKRLLAHVAKANPQIQSLSITEECLVVFQGPEAYISPTWYATKAETGRVVPTWNYAVVQVYGKPVIHLDEEWVRSQVTALTNQNEADFDEPWQVSDAPEDYIRSQLRGIVGIEIEITRMEGKWKMSQNKSEADRATVVTGLESVGKSATAEEVLSNAIKRAHGS